MPVVRAKSTFVHFMKGFPTHVDAGALFDVNDPCVKKFPESFEAVEKVAARRSAVEDATAEPGAKRSISAPVKRPAPKVTEGDG